MFTLDLSALAALAPAAATVITTLGAVALAWIARLRRRDELQARIAAKDHPELLDSIIKSSPPSDSIKSVLPIALIACAAGLTVQSGVNAARHEQQYAADLKKKCPGGCPDGSACNPRTGACEAQAVKPDKPRPKRIDAEPRIVRYPLNHDARLTMPTFWEPFDCKLNDCSEYEEDEL